VSFISKVQAQTEKRLTMVFLLWAWWSEREGTVVWLPVLLSSLDCG